jgi:hypothetical protein
MNRDPLGARSASPHRGSARQQVEHGAAGKRTLTEALEPAAPAPLAGIAVQRHVASAGPATDPDLVHAAAARGTSLPATALPHQSRIQALFGRHDVSGIQAHVGAEASAGARAMGAAAFATGNHVAFDGAPSLHTAAHEAAHVVQQRAGVHLAGGVGSESDVYEQHADAVADAVVQGTSAEALLDQHAPATGGGGAAGAVQRTLKDAQQYARRSKHLDIYKLDDKDAVLKALADTSVPEAERRKLLTAYNKGLSPEEQVEDLPSGGLTAAPAPAATVTLANYASFWAGSDPAAQKAQATGHFAKHVKRRGEFNGEYADVVQYTAGALTFAARSDVLQDGQQAGNWGKYTYDPRSKRGRMVIENGSSGKLTSYYELRYEQPEEAARYVAKKLQCSWQQVLGQFRQLHAPSSGPSTSSSTMPPHPSSMTSPHPSSMTPLPSSSMTSPYPSSMMPPYPSSMAPPYPSSMAPPHPSSMTPLFPSFSSFPTSTPPSSSPMTPLFPSSMTSPSSSMASPPSDVSSSTLSPPLPTAPRAIRVGDRVRIASGRFANATGTVGDIVNGTLMVQFDRRMNPMGGAPLYDDDGDQVARRAGGTVPGILILPRDCERL